MSWIGPEFFERDPVVCARELIGATMVWDSCKGRIVETEAYLGYQDKAAHSYGWRKTQRTRTMFADGGTAYVFLNYGIHRLLNIVVAKIDQPQAVLLRALEPTERRRRGRA